MINKYKSVDDKTYNSFKWELKNIKESVKKKEKEKKLKQKKLARKRLKTSYSGSSVVYDKHLQSSSFAEKRIEEFLIKNKISFEREVSFRGFCFHKSHPYRFDFYFPEIGLIIEYDGYHHQSDEKTKINDKIKNRFCQHNDISLTRLNKKHWNNLENLVMQSIDKAKAKRLNNILNN